MWPRQLSEMKVSVVKRNFNLDRTCDASWSQYRYPVLGRDVRPQYFCVSTICGLKNVLLINSFLVSVTSYWHQYLKTYSVWAPCRRETVEAIWVVRVCWFVVLYSSQTLTPNKVISFEVFRLHSFLRLQESHILGVRCHATTCRVCRCFLPWNS